MERDRAEVLPDPAANLEEAEAQGAELEVGHAEPSQPAADGVEQPVGGAVQQQAKLVGPERVAAQAIGEAALLVLFLLFMNKEGLKYHTLILANRPLDSRHLTTNMFRYPQ